MEQHPLPNPPHPANRHARWTPARQRLFLAALLEYGSVGRAAQAAGMSRSSAYRLRERLPGTSFDRAWTRAMALHAAQLADPFAPPALRQPNPRHPQ
ncbi:LysR family transcriptional regulator [Sphingobium rhizovicinum]|uniref:LysR family transcriptional regulator n=1 Tax=Sphingobium rhizovicinum TaxID=432308 RepID=A0ABV7ND55_9SPHN